MNHDKVARDLAAALKSGALCNHPARRGVHEEYARRDGSMFCRACGAELSAPGTWPMPKKER